MSKYIEKYKKMPVQVRASLWFLICSFLQKGISVITTPIFTRLLTTAEFGMYDVFDSWLGILTIFVSMRLYMGVYLQGVVKFSEDRPVFSSSMEGLSLALTLAWTIIYFLFRDMWNNMTGLTTVQMLAALVMIWSSSAFNFWSVEQRADYKYRKLVILTLAVSFLKPCLSIFLIKHAEDRVTARILGIAIVDLIGYVGLFVVQMKRGKVFYSKKYWKHALLFNLPLLPHYLSQTVLASSDRIMIERMVGASEAGIYGLACKLSQMMTMFNIALQQTLAPWIYQKIKENKIGDISRVSGLAIASICGVNLVLIAIAPEVLKIFAPAEYYKAVYCIPPVSMAVVFTFSYDQFAKFTFYYERTKLIAVASVNAALANIVLNYIAIPIFGYEAAAYTTLICYILYTGAHYILMNRACKAEGVIYPYNGRKLILTYSVFMLSGFALMATYEHPIIRYTVIAVTVIAAVVNYKRLVSLVSEFASKRKKRNV